jgi:anaerobic magnesium-protoporphyrin IX monomethyl ester cyclase
MKIVFYQPLVRPEDRFHPFRSHYLGFSSLRAYLYANEAEISIYTASTPEGIIDACPDLIGISSCTEMWEITKGILRWLREEGFSGPIVIGGPHITALPETLPPEADCAVLGEGEQTFLEIVRANKSSRNTTLRDTPGIAYHETNGQVLCTKRREPHDMDSLPVDMDVNPSIWFQISTIRGCPFHCFHCVEHDTQGKVRYLSADKLLWIMKKRFRITGNPNFFFQDDTFLVPRGRLKRLHDLMRKENLLGKFTIQSVSLNANLVEEHTIPLLKEIGVISLGIGIESLNPRILRIMKGNVVKSEHIDRTIRYAQQAGLPIGGSQVYGVPGETRKEMIDSIQKVQHYEFTTTFRHWVCYVCQPLPGSKFWQQELARGRVSLDMDFSCLRIDGDYRCFTTPWYYGNEEQVPRAEFIDILKKHRMLPKNFFLPPEFHVDEKPQPVNILKRVARRVYYDILKAIEGHRVARQD